ncbi:MAG: glycosyltransferase family 2 protein [Candidatus Hodarchaeota archaeon]
MNNTHKGSKLRISIVVPLLNEEKVVVEFYNRLKSVLYNLSRRYEIIFVEDGSVDSTLSELLKLQRRDNTIKIIKLRCNFGQTPALAAGFDHAAGEVVIAMDGDLQHSPEDIPKFIRKMDEGYDIVSGWRRHRKDAFLTRRLPSKIANLLMGKLSGVHLHDFGTTFKAYKREIIKEISLYGEFHRFIPVLASRIGVKIAEIPIENVRQRHRKSNYNLSRTVTVFFDLIRLNFFNKYLSRPLQIFGTLGLLLAFVGFCIEVHLIYMKYVHGLGLMTYRAPLLMLGVFMMIVGSLFIVLGLIGEMIFKLFHDLNPGRIYSIEKIYTSDGKAKKV